MATYYNGRHIVLTGASSGIGLALARHLSARGAVLLATGARAKADLPSEFPDIRYVSIDMAKPDCADKLAGAVADLGWPGIDLLILNAGTGRQAPVESETAQTIENVVAVNLAAPVRIAHRFAEPLIESAGQLVLVGSVVHKGADDFPVYAATKAALDGFARSLRCEWQGRIKVQIVHPGPTRTPMHQRAGHDPGKLARLFMSAGEAASLIAAAIIGGRSPVKINTLARLTGTVRRMVSP